MEKRFESYARLAAVVFLLIGCFYVLRPFLAAILFACAVTISSWPLYLMLVRRLKGRRTVAAAILTLSLVLLIIVPVALLSYNVADDIGRLYDQIRHAIDAGELAPPAWLRGIPLVGETADTYLRKLIGSREEMLGVAKNLLEPARHYLLGGGLVLGSALAQTSLAVFVCFFLFRDGQTILGVLSNGMQRVIGANAPQVATTVSGTVRGVMFGMLGTALAQALVALVGFLIAGVPGVMLLGIGTFIFSLIPVGPPLIWGGATIWLFTQGSTGWAIFMLIWGVVVISGVDNVVKPMLISRGSSLPFLLVLLGVLGGVLAFGFVGIFIGPTLLAVGFNLLQTWTGTPLEELPAVARAVE
jgi:predicted PurR-regulated permease PerM